jgi:hypothetical protein
MIDGIGTTTYGYNPIAVPPVLALANWPASTRRSQMTR